MTPFACIVAAEILAWFSHGIVHNADELQRQNVNAALAWSDEAVPAVPNAVIHDLKPVLVLIKEVQIGTQNVQK